MKWKEVELGKVCKVISGYAFKSKDFCDNGIIVLKIKNIRKGYTDLSDCQFVDSNYLSIDQEYHIERGDILIALTGSHTDKINSAAGRIARYTSLVFPCLLNQRAGKFVIRKNDLLWKSFLYYSLNTEIVNTELGNYSHGSANQANISPRDVEKIRIPLPPLPIQKKIASILSAYDDLIENNLRRIELLEKVARELYKEWFIYFRFPGYKKVKFKNGLPEGWEQKKLSDAIILNYGKALKAVDRINGKFPVYGSSGIVGWHDKHLVNGPGIIIGRKGNVGTVFWENQNYNPIDTVYYVCSEQSSLYLYYSLLSTNFQNNDGAVPGLNRDYAYSRNILKPAQEIIHQFHNIVIPLHNKINIINNQNKYLKQARDLLLPRLMKGEIEV